MDLSDNGFTTEGIKHFGNALQFVPDLNDLKLVGLGDGGDTGMGCEGMTILAQNLHFVSNLHTLVLTWNGIGDEVDPSIQEHVMNFAVASNRLC